MGKKKKEVTEISAESSAKENILEIKAVEDEDFGGSRLHFLFPMKPKGVERALHPKITGAVWIKKGEEVPDKIIIVLPKKGESNAE